MQSIDEILNTALNQIKAAKDLASLEALRVTYLGKKGLVTEQLKMLGKLASTDERRQVGQQVNSAKQQVQEQIQQHHSELSEQQLSASLASTTIDITLPGRRQTFGSVHPINQVRHRLEQLFTSMGFEVVEGPEIEDEYYNFEALNIPKYHPARTTHDTFFLTNELLLRTHTSPVQIRTMQSSSPPIRIVTPGRVYRCDSDNTHTPMFHQLEGLLVDTNTTFADLRGLLENLLQAFFDRTLTTRFRPSYFPFTEPSAEVDIQCVKCNGKGCRVCSHSGWLEILGCGMVHPNVLKHGNIDAEQFNGFAFGIGIDRLAMLLYGIDDLRILFDNDLRFLQQFQQL